MGMVDELGNFDFSQICDFWSGYDPTPYCEIGFNYDKYGNLIILELLHNGFKLNLVGFVFSQAMAYLNQGGCEFPK